ncbi:hypothetical protein HaLaN_25889, partial [Haematococcus lacustris]
LRCGRVGQCVARGWRCSCRSSLFRPLLSPRLQRVYEWLALRHTDLCLLQCAYVTHARNSRSKGIDGHGAKFTASSYVHRFNCIAHWLEVHHKMLLKEQPDKAVAGFTRPRFLVQGHSVWGELWDAVDGVCKLAAKAGELRISELHGLKRHFFTIVKDPKDPAARDMFKVDYQACKNWQGGLMDAGRVQPEKFIVPNPEYVPTGDAYVDAKVRTQMLRMCACFYPFECTKLYLSKLPPPAIERSCALQVETPGLQASQLRAALMRPAHRPVVNAARREQAGFSCSTMPDKDYLVLRVDGAHPRESNHVCDPALPAARQLLYIGRMISSMLRAQT